MKINIDIAEEHDDEISITIKAKEWSSDLDELIHFLKRHGSKRVFAVKEDQTILLDPSEIDYIYAAQRKVFAALAKENMEIKSKLYEIENILSPYHFMRFSKSVIGNLQQIERFELSFNGNLCVYFHSGNKEYISRKYVQKIKERLLMGGFDHVDGRD